MKAEMQNRGVHGLDRDSAEATDPKWGALRPGHYPPPHSQRYTAAQIVLNNRMAAIDRMRDRALEVGDLDMLDHADRLELDARAQYDRMMLGAPEPAPGMEHKSPIHTDPVATPIEPSAPETSSPY